MVGWAGLSGALLLVLTPLYLRVGTHLLTLAHEAGHALVVGLANGHVAAIRVDRDGGGVTSSSGARAAEVPSALAGYLAPSGVGLGVLALLRTGAVLGALVLLFAALVVMAVLVRNPFGLAVLVLVGAVLYLALRHGSAWTQAQVVGLLAWTLLLGAVRDAVGLYGDHRHGGGAGSDAATLARATLIPGRLWAGVFVVGTTLAATYAVWLTVG